jgi:cobalamin biosynthesis protein CbiG
MKKLIGTSMALLLAASISGVLLADDGAAMAPENNALAISEVDGKVIVSQVGSNGAVIHTSGKLTSETNAASVYDVQNKLPIEDTSANGSSGESGGRNYNNIINE